MKIIDCRVRPPFKSLTNVLKVAEGTPPRALPQPLRNGYEFIPSMKELSMDLFWKEFKEAGIEKAVLVGRKAAQRQISNDDLAEARLSSDRFIGALAGIDAAEAIKNIIETCDEIKKLVREKNFSGIVMDPGWCYPAVRVDDPRLYPIYATCAELGCIAYVSLSLMQNPGDISYADPAMIHRVATAFPKLNIVVVHAGFPYYAQMIGIMVNNSDLGNIWVLADFFMSLPGIAGWRNWVEAANNRICDQRMIWGSCYPVRPMKMAVDQFKALGFKDEVLEKIFSKNAGNLFK